MKLLIFALSLGLFACSQSEKNIAERTLPTEAVPEDEEMMDETFSLTYSWAGLGSNMGKLAPMFIIKNTHFTYTMEQNSYIGEPSKTPEKVCEGEIPESTIDSIIYLVKDIEDSLVYNTNINILSGGITSLLIQHEDINIEFRLHNASDPIAKKIVALLNAHIPKKHRKLSIWEDL